MAHKRVQNRKVDSDTDRDRKADTGTRGNMQWNAIFSGAIYPKNCQPICMGMCVSVCVV